MYSTVEQVQNSLSSKLIRQLQSVTLVYEPQSLCGKPYIAYLCKFMQRTRRTAATTTTSVSWLAVTYTNWLLIQLSRLLFWSYIIMHSWWRKNSCKAVEKQWEKEGKAVGKGRKKCSICQREAHLHLPHITQVVSETLSFPGGSHARLEEQPLRQPICLHTCMPSKHTHTHTHTS